MKEQELQARIGVWNRYKFKVSQIEKTIFAYVEFGQVFALSYVGIGKDEAYKICWYVYLGFRRGKDVIKALSSGKEYEVKFMGNKKEVLRIKGHVFQSMVDSFEAETLREYRNRRFEKANERTPYGDPDDAADQDQRHSIKRKRFEESEDFKLNYD